MNCHGLEIMKYLEQIYNVVINYSIEYICTYGNLNNLINDKEVENILFKIKNCDVLITNNIKNYEKINYNNICEIVEKKTKIIKIEYFRFNGFYPYECVNTVNYFDCYDIKYNYNNYNDFLNAKIINDDLIKKNFDEELDKLKKLDDNSDIKIYDYFIENYKTKLLFRDRNHPSNYIFRHIVKQILKLLEINFNNDFDQFDQTYKFGIAVRYKIIDNITKNILNLNYNEENIYFLNNYCSENEYFTFTQQIKNKTYSNWHEVFVDYELFLNNNDK